MNGKLIICHGLPGSGKSTWAENEVLADPFNTVRVNRDDIRTQLFGEKYHQGDFPKQKETQVTNVQQELIKKGLREGKTVISDDTNLNSRFLMPLVKMGRDYGAEISQQHFDVPIDECKRRNALRGKAGGRLVPDFVIDRMAENGYADGRIKKFIIGQNNVFGVSQDGPGKRFLEDYNNILSKKNPMLGKAVVLVDIDGTAANNSHYADLAFGDPNKKKNFPLFYNSLKDCPVNKSVVELARNFRYSDKLNLFVLTGRTDDYAKILTDFVDRTGMPISRVIMKREGDFRPDSEFKPEAIDELENEGLTVVHAIDDRPRVLEMFANRGILTSVVPFHNPQENGSGKPYPEPKVISIYGTGYCIRCGSPLSDGGNIGPICRGK